MVGDKSQSEGSYNIKLKPFKGNYFFTIVSAETVKLSIVLAKKAFTHLVATRSVLMNDEAIF